MKKEEVAKPALRDNIIASMIVAIGFISAAYILASFPGASSAQSRAANVITSNAQTYGNGSC